MIKTTKDGRTIRSGSHYTLFRKAVWTYQNCRCLKCGSYVPFDPEFFHVHHVHGRGMGGSKRDDIFAGVEGLCMYCHRIEHNQ